MDLVKQRSVLPGRFGLVGGAVAEHGEQDVAAAAGQADAGGAVTLPVVTFPLVIRSRDGVGQGGERGREHRAFDVFVAVFGLVVRRGKRCRRSG